jgi:hypothetical protein
MIMETRDGFEFISRDGKKHYYPIPDGWIPNEGGYLSKDMYSFNMVYAGSSDYSLFIRDENTKEEVEFCNSFKACCGMIDALDIMSK